MDVSLTGSALTTWLHAGSRRDGNRTRYVCVLDGSGEAREEESARPRESSSRVLEAGLEPATFRFKSDALPDELFRIACWLDSKGRAKRATEVPVSRSRWNRTISSTDMSRDGAQHRLRTHTRRGASSSARRSQLASDGENITRPSVETSRGFEPSFGGKCRTSGVRPVVDLSGIEPVVLRVGLRRGDA